MSTSPEDARQAAFDALRARIGELEDALDKERRRAEYAEQDLGSVVHAVRQLAALVDCVPPRDPEEPSSPDDPSDTPEARDAETRSLTPDWRDDGLPLDEHIRNGL